MLTPADLPPGYRLVNSTVDDLLIEDDSNDGLFIDGGVTDRTLRFEVRAVDRRDGSRGTVRGFVLFDLMMRHFGGTFDVIAAYWYMDGTNLERFNAATAAGCSEETAGWMTWTGGQALRHGFKTLAVRESLGGGPGRYGLVRVWYFR